MRTIHLLGPQATDSYQAFEQIKRPCDQVRLHPDFESIIDQLADFVGDYLLLPVVFQCATRDYGFREFNFDYWHRLAVVSVHALPTKPMVLIENRAFIQDRGILQPAVSRFFHQFCRQTEQTIGYELAASKHQAYEKCLQAGYRYTICSADVIDQSAPVDVLETFHPTMIWCLYYVKGETASE